MIEIFDLYVICSTVVHAFLFLLMHDNIKEIHDLKQRLDMVEKIQDKERTKNDN